jgi:ABC-2 type transport system permease protein
MTTREATRETLEAPRDPGIGAVISSEFSKLTSVPTQRVLLYLAIGIAALMAVVFYVSLPVTQGRAVSDLAPEQILEVGILGVDAAALISVVLAAIHVGSEYSTGMIQSTLTITPSRGRVLAGKFVTVAATSLAVGAIAAAVCVGAALIVAGAVGLDPGRILTATGIRLTLGSIAMPVLYSVMAAAAAFVCRSTALGIVVPLGVMAVGGLAGWFGESVSAVLTPLMPVAAIHSLSGVATGRESIGIAGATLSLLVWLGISVGAAAWRFVRRDA